VIVALGVIIFSVIVTLMGLISVIIVV